MSYETDKYTELFTRLEKATAALEGIVTKHRDSISPPSIVSRSVSNAVSSVATESIEEPASIKEFNEFLELYVDPFVSTSSQINESVGEIALKLLNAFKYQINFIKAAGESKKPDFSSPSISKLLSPLQELIQDINQFKDDNRRSEFFSHLNAVAEGTGVLSWFLTETPVSFIPEIKDSATFWTNKVLKEFKEKDAKNVDWVKEYLNIFEGLKSYVKQYHTTGLTWNPNGGDFASNLQKETPAATATAEPVPPPAASAGGPPPPPPPPPADLFDEKSSKPAGGIGAVFSELNQGEGITKGLKKVEKSQMTHKNPELRQSSIVRSKSNSSQNSNGKKAPPIPKKPNSLTLKSKPEPVIELQDNKWIIKNIEDNHEIVINGELSQSVFIADSTNSTIQIKGKVNAISLSSTTKVALVLDSAISGISIINSKKFGIQIIDKIPQISIDKSDEGQIYLSKTSLETEIYTTSTTSLNVNIPDEEIDDFKEVNIPEQFKFTFKEGKLVSEVVEHAG